MSIDSISSCSISSWMYKSWQTLIWTCHRSICTIIISCSIWWYIIIIPYCIIWHTSCTCSYTCSWNITSTWPISSCIQISRITSICTYCSRIHTIIISCTIRWRIVIIPYCISWYTSRTSCHTRSYSIISSRIFLE